MSTLTQVFYNKLCTAPKGWYQSQEGRKHIATIAKLKDGVGLLN